MPSTVQATVQRQPLQPNPTQRRGFTLIDLLITVMIIGIMAAVAAPKFAHLADGYRADAAAKMIVNDLNIVRRKAMAVSGETKITFQVAANKYTITGLDNLDHSVQPNEVLLADTGYSATLVSAAFDTFDTIEFDHFGRPYAVNGANETALISGAIVIQSGGESRTIVINPTTGKASIQ